jgi:hypothetical protein
MVTGSCMFLDKYEVVARLWERFQACEGRLER